MYHDGGRCGAYDSPQIVGHGPAPQNGGTVVFNGVTPDNRETPVTDVTTSQGHDGVEFSAADEQLLRDLTERAWAGGLKLTGEGGLLGKLTKMVVEGALEGELDDHPGYEKNDPAGRNGGNSRNGYRVKTVLTEAGPAEFSVPRDRDSSFEPKIAAKRALAVASRRWRAVRHVLARCATAWRRGRSAVEAQGLRWGPKPLTRPLTLGGMW